jgi:hypothetical protein
MLTLKIESTTYTLKSPERAAQVQELASKKARRKPITAGCGRSYPRFGANLSTHAYVRDYYAMNALGESNHFAPLSKHISVPQGVDSMEVEQ